MSAAVLLGHGGPEQLRLRHDVPVPRPGPGEVLVQVAACAVNNTDLNTRLGWYDPSVTGGTAEQDPADAPADGSWDRGGIGFPRIQGADVCGRVVAGGAGTALEGARVLVDPWVRDPDDPSDRSRARFLGSELDGGFAQYCVVPERNAHPVSSELSDVELAGFPCSWSTAGHMLARIGLTAGQRIAVTGASGGVGSALVQLAALDGARVVAVTGGDKAAAVAALGAREVVARGTDSVERALRAAGGPLDAVADVVGGADVPRWLEALRPGGRFVTSGAIAGPVVEIDLRTLYLHDLELIGATVVPREVFADLVARIESGAVRSPVAATYPLERIHEAQRDFMDKAHVGKLVIEVPPPEEGGTGSVPG